MKQSKLENRLANAAIALIALTYFAPIPIACWVNSRWRDIGEGYKVNDFSSARRLIYIGSSFGQARVCIDEDKDGTLDGTYVNMPISPAMGGPGYRLMKVQTTDEDRRKFERVNHLLSLEANIK